MSVGIDEAIRRVQAKFPFGADYIEPQKAACYTIGRILSKHLAPGAKVLDLGCGPCDKTAVAREMGFQMAGCDDLSDDWHTAGGNRDKILAFARKEGIDFRLLENGKVPFTEPEFDMVMMHDILEHLHDSPRDMLNDFMSLTKPDGYFFASVPNAVNIRKRINVIFGKTNHPTFESYYWYPGPWRGHVREYVRSDMSKLCEFLGLDVVELDSCHHMLEKVPGAVRPLYAAVTAVFKGWRDSWYVVGKKKPGWRPKKTLTKAEMQEIFGHEPHCLLQD